MNIKTEKLFFKLLEFMDSPTVNKKVKESIKKTRQFKMLAETTALSLMGRTKLYQNKKKEWDEHYKDVMDGYKAELNDPETPMKKRVQIKDQIRSMNIINQKKQEQFKRMFAKLVDMKKQLKGQYFS